MTVADRDQATPPVPFAHPLSGWPTPPPPGYLGQLEPDFQRQLAAAHAHLRLDDCDWYHTTELVDGTVKDGHWDLRGHESVYLGNLSPNGKTILEFGPASGHLTYWMESQGARVTCFEVGYDARFEQVPPVDGTDMDTWYSDFMRGLTGMNNGWWLQHRDRGSNARIAYGDIYNLPADIGQYEIAVFGSILLHLRDPFRALQQAALRTTEAIVVTDLLRPGIADPDDPVMRWGMEFQNTGPSQRWWHLSPGAVTMMLWRLGFGREQLLRHRQVYTNRTSAELTPAEIPLFTVVATRRAHHPKPPVPVATRTQRLRSRAAPLRKLLNGKSSGGRASN